MGPSLLLCKVEGGRRWGVELHPNTGMKELSLQSLPTGSHTCTRTHTAKTPNTGWGARARGARTAGQGQRRRSCRSHSVPATPKPQRPPHCSTCPRVSGSFRARELPRARAAEAKRMGAALVIPTKDVKMLIPNTAASLHRAFRKPKAVVLFRGPRVQPAQQGDKDRGMGGGDRGGRVWGNEGEWQPVSKRDSKDRGQRGKGCTSGNTGGVYRGGRGEAEGKTGLIVKTSRSEYKSYQLLQRRDSMGWCILLPVKMLSPVSTPSSPHFSPAPHHTPSTSCPRGRVRQSTRPARSRMQC